MIDEAKVREIATGAFLEAKRNAIFVGGTGMGRSTFIGFTSEDKAAMVLTGLVLAVSFAVNQVLQHRFLTQR